MKVAVVTRYFPTSITPWAGHSAYQTLRELAKLCHVHVFCPEPSYPALLTPPSSRGPKMDRNWRPSDVEVTYVPCPIFPVLSRPLNGLITTRQLLPHVRRFHPDILFNYFIYPDGYAAVRIGKRLGVPAVLKAIGSDLNRIPDPLISRLVSFTLRHADFTTTVSSALRDRAVSLGADPAHTKVILNGCDTTIFHPRSRTEARQELELEPEAEVAVYVGRLDVRKGLMELIAAAVELHPRRPKLHFYIVGDGPDKPIVQAAIAKHRAASYITLVPSCLTRRVATWMTAADLVTLPSYNEGCPNVVLEALAAGRPVVATRVGGIPELMDDGCGRMVPPRDVPALTQALDEVLDRTWSDTAISSEHSRSWAEVACELHRILEELISPNLRRK